MIETGLIEGIYTIDRGVTQTLIEHGLKAGYVAHGASDISPERLEDILLDQEDAFRLLVQVVADERPISTSFIKELHQLLCRHQATTTALIESTGERIEVELLRGAWKIQANNPTTRDGREHAYAPPIEVAAEMDRLVAWHAEHRDRGIDAITQAAWLHHRFTQIHPFQDGNGRVARSLATIVLLRDRLLPLVVDRDERVAYINTLERADAGHFSELVDVFGSLQFNRLREIEAEAVDLMRPEDVAWLAAKMLADRQSQVGRSHDAASRQVAVEIERIGRTFQRAAASMRSSTEGAVQGLAIVVSTPAFDLPPDLVRQARARNAFEGSGARHVRFEGHVDLMAERGVNAARLDVSIAGAEDGSIACISRIERRSDAYADFLPIAPDDDVIVLDAFDVTIIDGWVESRVKRWMLEVGKLE